ncbi:type I 3-dehydroquinate dehydratase [Clostridium botulinum]|uniref:type I 3-dehydroquinate dehydratase n=1 Tax=Clostridium botulinum TaxID=1491 RepID=UPI0007749F1C|nr:type I 3-dehydroquinate dehydratase [Clostridium botulinum]NFH81350.1 type I 3-dehydroquinate dehydratase [Clostridium botulinum]NFH84866.1 type I 3-dehydroquinate dehydratase [Clostridium botulinum]NFI12518.1 type I 3-dehydroquinate dehydratase [Clostridium botulinum]NFI15401.1 type I 3-dehydroquinate dehydratase [Clostridium botulinum]NFL87579.1 type I 3-dehydroquinate dehydratase [Clostridium botulinum]
MNKVVQVKNVKIGEDIPKICVPIVGATSKEILDEAENLKELTLDIVEWRVDFYEEVFDIEKVKEILSKLTTTLKEIPLIFTFRNKIEGGEREIPIEYYLKLNLEVAKTKLVDLIDVELFIGDDLVKEIVEVAHDNDVKVIISNHDFFKTPCKEEIISRLIKMIQLNGDLPKIAVMPQCEIDVLTLLYATNEVKHKYPNNSIITMSMSGRGIISRIAGEIFGSCLTFGAAKKASAPGQIGVEELNSVLKVLHENI